MEVMISSCMECLLGTSSKSLPSCLLISGYKDDMHVEPGNAQKLFHAVGILKMSPSPDIGVSPDGDLCGNLHPMEKSRKRHALALQQFSRSGLHAKGVLLQLIPTAGNPH